MSKKRRSFENREAKLMLEFLDKGQVLQEWDLNVKKMKKIGNDYKIKTHRGEKMLKVGFHEEQIMFMHLALEHLAQNGCYKGIPRLIPTKYGDYYVKNDLGIYYLTDWVEGKHGKAKDLDRMIDFAKFMAEVHFAAKDFQVIPYWAIRERWSDLSDQMTGKIEKINQKLEDLPCELRDAWATYEAIGKKALNLLRLSGYRSLIERAKKNKTICHRQFSPKSGVISKGAISILDWEHCAYGVQIADLVYYLQKVMPAFEWNKNVGAQVIRAYHQIKPLSREEIMTLGTALMFPVAFVKLVEKYLLGKVEEDKVNIKLEHVKELEEKKNNFLEKFFKEHDLKGFCWGENSSILSNTWYLTSLVDLKNYTESRAQAISCFLLPSFTVNAQGRLQEEFDMEIHRALKDYQVPIFPVVYTLKNSQERENVLQVLADHYLRERLVAEIERIIEVYDFPGVNISFEVISEEEMAPFNKFIKSLFRITHENGKTLLVSAAAAKGENLYYDYEYIGKYCDYLLVEITEKDLSCPGSTISKSFIQSAMTYAAAHISKEKIVSVLPVHGETAEIVLEKAFLARQLGIAGCAFWRLGLEDPELWDREPASGFCFEESSHDADEED